MAPASHLLVLPDRTEHPFRNMEEDLLLLYQNPAPDAFLFRHYGWEFPCWTCGYSQKFSYVKDCTGGTQGTIFRRGTGGGIVPHKNDWTFSMVIGNGHSAWHRPPRDFYDVLHKQIAVILGKFHIPAQLHKCEGSLCNGAPPSECFRSPVLSDVLLAGTGEKVAGAAIKKTREGILLQGSIQKEHLPAVPWEAFKNSLVKALAQDFGCSASAHPWPFSAEDKWPPYAGRIHCPAWLKK